MRSLALVEKALALAEKHGLVELEIPGLVRLVRRPSPPPKLVAEPGADEHPGKKKPVPVAESEAFRRWERGEGVR